MASKVKAWGQKRGYSAGRKTVAELRPPAKSVTAKGRRKRAGKGTA